MLHKTMHSQLRKKKLALDKLQSCLCGRVVKAMDLRSDGRFLARKILIFMMMMVERRTIAQSSLKRESVDAIAKYKA